MIITYPSYPFKIKQEQGKDYIFDEARKRWVILTPEEWVRQNFIQYLVQIKKYPLKLLAVEKQIKVGEVKKRCDIVVHKNSKPWLIVECKEQNVSLSAQVLQQVLVYNIPLQAGFIVVTNGNNNFAWQISNGHAIEIDELPNWQEL